MHSRSFGEEIEDDTIGDLHPDEDDLFSGVTDALGSSAHAKTTDDFEDSDLFSSGGGMELEGDELLVSGKRISGLELDGDPAYFGGCKGKSPFGEQSFRTLFVRNITSNEEDSELKALFEQYGDIRTIYTACKHQGFVLVSYYDLRAAQNAMKALQNRGASAVTVSDARESSNAVDAMKFASISRFHPHSLPEYCVGLANGSPYILSNTIKMTANIGTGSTEASDRRHIQGMSSTGNLA
ncbi:hypothetical protein P8452_62212 [Trifolium repens]|nr:hypothetical protein P8452_62212 [Trifolium repens]